MSPQIIELIIFAIIAFLIISKLISILGTTDEDPKYRGSSFGEPSGLKDVTSKGSDWSIPIKIPVVKPKEKADSSILAYPDNSDLLDSLDEVGERVEKFTPSAFLRNVSKAWKIIIEAIKSNDKETIETLVDKRYIEASQERADSYSKVDLKKLPEVKISDVTFFGNSIMIKVIINSDGIDKEEWTFARNENQTGQHWYLSNIERFA